MGKLRIYSKKDVKQFISVRPGETKLGEKIEFIDDINALRRSKAAFVLLGIPEDIGVRANYGKAGTASAWEACLSALLNVQDNYFNASQKILLLGEIDCTAEMAQAANIDREDPNYHEKLGDIVAQIDRLVSAAVNEIIVAGKVPVVIGGGHNNAFGNIKGTSEGLRKAINILNIDAHTDLRETSYRHSGNGFSYARKEGFLKKYAVFGLHQNYTPQYIFEEMDASADLEYTLLEDLDSSEELETAFKKTLSFVNGSGFGLEVDCDAVANFPSSAISPSGFSLDEIRRMLRTAAREKNCLYLHLCEAISKEGAPTGKALAYLVTDFIKSKAND